MGEELNRRHHFVVGVFVAKGYVVHFLEGVQDEEKASVLHGADAVLIIEAVVPKSLELLLLPRFDLSRDRGFVFAEGGVVPVERDRYSRLVLVCRVRKYKAGDFSSFIAGKTNRKTCLKEDFLYSSEVVVLRLADDWGEGLDCGFEFGGDVG